ncbi:zinc finger BED domain-containing protein RICESLEEPER 2-like [Pyrus ussuriensis x Pyrus communis]|uniref:Zinc finger BED domain-containing protein RICESLEEPER 2-like n=1 Tax=Pyrus ussuriensis x Pyrus communis TaxID=2448454 RepID=A0A5N5GKZ4_9ROSA|nr:zinc finger BED domain-containing protein RICESLEEPER 2-like [Pyrus ussuriensis x Pyrus communis]
MEDADINEDGDSQSVDQSSQNGSNHMPPFIYSQHNMRRGLAKYIASTAQLLTSAEHVRFERFIKSYVQPQYSSVPLNLIRGDCLKLFNEKKNFMTSELCGFVGDVINSIAVQGLKLMEAHIEKIRRGILCLASSPARQEDFKPDMKTHWNSTLLMLQSCVDYKAAITDFYNGNHDSDLLCEADWELGFVFMEFLSVFYEVAVSFGSRVYSSSSCMALHHLFCISFTFSKHKVHSGFKAIYDIMESEFRSYCEFMLPSFCLAKAMDPRMKLCGVQHIVNNISKFTEPCTTSNSKRRRLDIHASWREYVRQEDIRQYGPTELHIYLGINYAGSMTEKEYDNLDVLAWWKLREGMFPLLSVCAIAPEFVFSSAGKQVLDHRRSMQSPKMLDCMFCLKDWEDARH